jgi:hypothetical protein
MIGKLSSTTSYQALVEQVAPGAIPDRLNLPDLAMVLEIVFPKPILEKRNTHAAVR